MLPDIEIGTTTQISVESPVTATTSTDAVTEEIIVVENATTTDMTEPIQAPIEPQTSIDTTAQ